MSLVIKNGGLLTTIQDIGRYGYQNTGISPAGPMDIRSFKLANILAGNDENEACLECTLLGPTIEFTAPAYIAITGGDLAPQINSAPAPAYRGFAVRAGDVLSFQQCRSGCRCYIAVAGGLDVPDVLGSKATLVRAEMGGWNGRKLAAGDAIGQRTPKQVPGNASGRSIPPESFQNREIALRVILGPQDDRFTREGVHSFLHSPYTVSNECDRMGYRLNGDKIEHVRDANIMSDGIALGSIQVPGSGLPIIMMAERQTSGGYTKIANVITVDLPFVGQAKPGDVFLFREVSVGRAQDLYMEQARYYDRLRKSLDTRRFLILPRPRPTMTFLPELGNHTA